MKSFIAGWRRLTAGLVSAGDWLALLPLRLLLAWEFWESGIIKLQGENWFGDVQDSFPFPFNVVPVDISWFLATWTEILGALGLALGLFTRFWALALIILSIVAIGGVHWPDDWDSLAELWKGYAITDKGFGSYKLPLLFIVMLIPLVLLGPGKASLDRALSQWLITPTREARDVL
jgi:putative oxidoreductase